jgi:hypothetical protein
MMQHPQSVANRVAVVALIVVFALFLSNLNASAHGWMSASVTICIFAFLAIVISQFYGHVASREDRPAPEPFLAQRFERPPPPYLI